MTSRTNSSRSLCPSRGIKFFESWKLNSGSSCNTANAASTEEIGGLLQPCRSASWVRSYSEREYAFSIAGCSAAATSIGHPQQGVRHLLEVCRGTAGDLLPSYSGRPISLDRRLHTLRVQIYECI